VIESLEGEIRILRSLFWSDRDPDGRGFAPLADAYRRVGDVKQAIELLNDGLDRHPGFSPGYVVAARLYAEQGLFAEAEIAARNALELDAENIDAIGSLIAALEDRAEIAEVKALRSQLSVLEPEVTEEATADFSALAPDGPEADDDVIADFGALAPDEPVADEDVVVDFGALAPDEPEAHDDVIADFGALAPDEPEADDDVIADFGALAPDEPEADDETIADCGALAPDEPEADDDVIVDFGAMAPDVPAADDDVIADFGALAPDEPEADDAAIADFGALAPDEPEADDDVIVDFGALAPDESVPTDEIDPFDAGMVSLESLEDDVLEAEAITLDEPNAASASETPPPSDAINTRTMAALYASQGLVDRAADVYRHLLQENPGDEDLRARLAEIDTRNAPPKDSVVQEEEVEAQARELAGSGDHEHDVDTPFTWTEHEGEAPDQDGPTMGDFFSRLLSRESKGDDAS